MNTSLLTHIKRKQAHGAGLFTAVAIALFGWSAASSAGTLEQAKRMHDRLTGVPPTETILLQMKAELDKGESGSVNGVAAAMIAMEHDGFYNVTLKNWAAPWTNREQDVFVPLNDYTSTVVGFVRDELDFRELLYADILYVGDSSGLPAYSNSNNDHYEQLESSGVSLKDTLVSRSQSSLTGLPSDATAGVVTSRAAARSFFKAGTNRANFRFTLLNHLCMDLEQVHDVSRVPDRIRQDVSRSPGGDARVYLNNCLGCHAGMDPLAQAFAYYDYLYDADEDLLGENGQISYNAAGTSDPETGTRVKAKYHINSATFPGGYVTPNDNWENYWRKGQNQVLGWDAQLPGSGSGARSMLQELAHTEAFASCQVKKVFQAVCLREPGDADDRAAITSMVSSFKNTTYNIKQVFAESADYCKGGDE
ncbi:hypothetical protein SAMN02745866_04021 [Alteromonadaceae bacterium Bs31]|nr:hypothetical protein SAMN02745866_04021 [Alteromonadaceae bacterium Bs31]